MSNEVEIKPKQSFFDLAIQEYGNVEAAFELVKSNDSSLTSELVPGESVIKPSLETLTEQSIVTFFKKKKIYPATALSQQDLFNSNPEGIDYMIIESTFIVS